MAKLKGKAKADFLKRMAKGRKAAAKKTKTKSKPKSKPKTKTVIKSKPKRKTMVSRKKKIYRGARRGSKSISSSLKTGVIGEVVKGIGAGSLVNVVMSRVAPGSSITPIASTGAAFLAGGVVGGAANLVLSGGLSQLGGIFGGGATAPQQEFGV